MTDAPIKVRVLSDPRSQLAALAVSAAVVTAVVVAVRWRHFGPLVATRTSRKLRAFARRCESAAQSLEDAGLNIARTRRP